MTITSQILIYGIGGFIAGYLLGRIGHYYINDLIGNPAWLPHHWIYGAILIPTSSLFNTSMLGLFILFFGVGHLALKFISADEEGQKRFFHID